MTIASKTALIIKSQAKNSTKGNTLHYHYNLIRKKKRI